MEEIKKEEEKTVVEKIVGDSENPLYSKTVWYGVALAILPLIPKWNVWWTNNPKMAGAIIGAIVILLRLVTGKKLTIASVLDIFKKK